MKVVPTFRPDESGLNIGHLGVRIGQSMRYHITWSTYGAWLPGDPRGFRTRHHRMHVDGDYRHPPPAGKYDALHAWMRSNMPRPAVVLAPELRCAAGEACVAQFAKEDVALYVISVGGQHVHAAADCPADGLKQMIGRVKKVSSHAIRRAVPGAVWAQGCALKVVRDEEHWRNVLQYVQDHALEGAWVWKTQGL